MNYPYSTATGTIAKILSKIQTVGQPANADRKWMSSIGFTKSSEQRMIAILKFLNFTDSKGAPTERWVKFRSNKSGLNELGKAIKESYKELYDIYPEAHKISKDELNHFFTTRTTAGALALSHTVNTFKNLANFAKFDDGDDQQENFDTANQDTQHVEAKRQPEKKETNSNDFANQLSKQFKESKNGLTINLNIQLSVPETTDEKVYDKFFESLKKHLLS